MAFVTSGRATTSTLTILFESDGGQYAVDADDTPVLTITRDGDEYLEIDATAHPSVGSYDATWTPTLSGEYALVWSFAVSGVSYTVADSLFVLDPAASSSTAGGTFTRTALKDHAKIQLGYPALCVELSESQLDDAVDEAEVWVATHLGQVKKTTITLVSGVTEYDMPDDCEAVADVAPPQRSSLQVINDTGIEGIEGLYLARSYGNSARSGGYASSFYQSLQDIEMKSRVFSSEVEYHWEPSTRKLIVAPSRVGGPMVVWYISNEVDYTKLTLQVRHLMRRYVVAQAMMMLGRIRSKYSEVPGSGGKITLNGSDLVTSAETELSLLEDKMRALSPPVPFIAG